METPTLNDKEAAAKAALAAKRAENAKSESTTCKFQAACTAFIKAQGEFEPVALDKQNPHFKSKYASLSAILKATLPALNRNGIALTSRTVVNGENIIVKTYLIHAGLAFVKAEWPAGKVSTPPQQLGSALTYARRYSIQSALGIAAEEDDDGNAAQNGNAAQPPPSF